MKRILAVLAVALLVASVAFPVIATPPLGVHIEVPTAIPGEGPDPYTASGPAVDAGLIFPTGQAYSTYFVAAGPPGGSLMNLLMGKRFIAADGSGTFDLKLVIRLDLVTGTTTANWNVLRGTGAYEGLHGVGKLVGVPLVPGQSILDIYDGKLH